MHPLLKKTVDLFSSYGLACVVLLLLFLLTWLGTLAQVDMSLHDAQKKYFDSWLVLHSFRSLVIPGLDRPLTIPLPGGQLLMIVLFVNLVVGGMIRIKKSSTKVGILIGHVGIAMLLIAGWVKFAMSDDGYLRIWEGEQVAHFESYYHWELAVSEELDDGQRREYLIPAAAFADLGAADRRAFQAGELPFAIELRGYARNSVVREGETPPGAAGAGGFWIRQLPNAASAEGNLPAVCVALIEANGTRHESVVRGTSPITMTAWTPWLAKIGGKDYAVEIRRERYPLPFRVRLDDFRWDRHPGISMARSYESDVTVIEGDSLRPVNISMNEPLREAGYVMFQSDFGPKESSSPRRMYSHFSVVRNPSDQWPLYSCLVIALGLLVHFMSKLSRYIRSESRKAAEVAAQAGRAGALLAALVVPAAALGAQRAPGAEDPHVGHSHAVDDTPTGPARTEPWPAEVLDAFAKLPIQDGGRIKPLYTYASYTMLRMNGMRTCKTPSGERVKPVAWLLDALLYPEQAKRYRCFVVQDDEAIEAIGLSHEGRKKRDRYSYAEISPARARLISLAQEYGRIDEKRLTRIQKQVLGLYRNYAEFTYLTTYFDFARRPIEVDRGELARQVYGGAKELPFSAVVAKGDDLFAAFRTRAEAAREDQAARESLRAEAQKIDELFEDLHRRVQFTHVLALLPPATTADKQEEWHTPEYVAQAFRGEQPVAKEHVAMLAAMERMVAGRDDPRAFATALNELKQASVALAEPRGEYDKIGLEVFYHKTELFYWSLILFVFGFLAIAISWLLPRARWLRGISWTLTVVPLALVIVGITLRCILRERPPVSTLYETIPFITAVGVLVALTMEWINRKRIALPVASLLGVGGMFFTMRREVFEGSDTMPQLVAVLDTNFWLSTHVTTVTIGYSAGLLAAFIAHIYILGKLFNFRSGDRAFYKNVARMTYGVVAFGLVFATVGTILGGIWANDSWGRFWGWDPKENGALMICLWMIAMLHGRMGGYLRDLGFCIAAVVGGTVVAFSWFHVNMLGVGLHAYGFTDGAWWLWAFYYSQWGVAGLGGIVALTQRQVAAARAAATATGE